MTKIASHITPLPEELQPAKSSTELINFYVQRLVDSGRPQKIIARALGFGPNYISMLKKGDELPLPRVIAFAAAAELSDAERFELLDTRLMELHGGKGEFCVATLAAWGAELFSPVGDEGKLVQMWREAASPAPHMLVGLLDDEKVAARVKAVLEEVVQEELRARQAE